MTNIIFSAFVAAGPYVSNPYLEALGQIESGNQDKAIGNAGERSRYQIMRFVWKDNTTYNWTRCVEPDIAARVAYEILIKRLAKLHDKQVDPRWLYVAWNHPALLRDNITWRDMPIRLCEKALRYENLVLDAQIQKAMSCPYHVMSLAP